MVNPFFKNHGPFKIIELIQILKLKDLNIDLDLEVSDIADLYSSKKGDITFFHSKKYKELANITKASFCITTENLKDELSKNCIPLIVSNVLISTSIITSKFYPDSLHDNFDDKESHVIPGLMGRMHKAKKEDLKKFEVWGTGKPLREFLFVDDLADAISFIIENEINEELINIGSNEEISINDLVSIMMKVVDFQGDVFFNPKYPDGNPRKLLDSSKILSYGWKPKVNILQGLKMTYDWYLKEPINN